MCDVKRCPTCGTTDRERFGRNRATKDGLSSYCLLCKAARQRAWLAKRPGYARRRYHEDPVYREKAKARARSNMQASRGKMKRQRCERCGFPVAQKHHLDYSKPEDIVWLCADCHIEEHLR